MLVVVTLLKKIGMFFLYLKKLKIFFVILFFGKFIYLVIFNIHLLKFVLDIYGKIEGLEYFIIFQL